MVQWKQPARVLLRQDCVAVVCVGLILEGNIFLFYDVMLRVAYGTSSGRLTNMCENQLEKLRKIRPAPVDFEVAETRQIDGSGGPKQIVDGGILTVVDWCIVGYQAEDVGDNAGRIEVYDGGVLNCNARLYVSYRTEGFLTVYEGGTVNIHSQLLGVGQQPGG